MPTKNKLPKDPPEKPASSRKKLPADKAADKAASAAPALDPVVEQTPTPAFKPFLAPAPPPKPPPPEDRPSTEPITAWEEMLILKPSGDYTLVQIGEVIPTGSYMGDGSTITPPMTDSLGRISRPVTQVLPGATEEEIAQAMAQGMVLNTTRPPVAMPHPSRGPAPAPVRQVAPSAPLPAPVAPPRPTVDSHPNRAPSGVRESVIPRAAPVQEAPPEDFSEPPPATDHPTVLWPRGDKVVPTLEDLPLKQGDPIEFVHKGRWVGGYAIVEDKGPNQRMIGAYLAGRPLGATPANGERVPLPPGTPAYHANPKGYSFIPGNHNSLREGGALPMGASLARYPVIVRVWDKEPGAWVRGAMSRPQDDRVVFVSEDEILAGKGPWDVVGRLATDAAVHFPDDSKFCDWPDVLTAVRRRLQPEEPAFGYESPPRPGSREESAAWAQGNYMTPHASTPPAAPPTGYAVNPSPPAGAGYAVNPGPIPGFDPRDAGAMGSHPTRPIVAMPPVVPPGGASVFTPVVLNPEQLTRAIMVVRARFHTTPLAVFPPGPDGIPQGRNITDGEICDMVMLILGALTGPQ